MNENIIMSNNENNNLKKCKERNVLLVIVAVLLILLIGLLCYKMLILDKKSSDTNVVDKSDVSDNNKGKGIEVTPIYDDVIKKVDNGKQEEILYHYLSKQPIVTLYLDNKGNVYLENHFDIVSNDVLGEKEKFDFYGLGKLEDDAYEASKALGMDYINAYKLQNNIRSIAIYEKGNGGTTADIVLISKDNKASIYELTYDSKNITNISIKKNIISDIISSKKVENSVSRDYHLIDINNNEYSVEFS